MEQEHSKHNFPDLNLRFFITTFTTPEKTIAQPSVEYQIGILISVLKLKSYKEDINIDTIQEDKSLDIFAYYFKI